MTERKVICTGTLVNGLKYRQRKIATQNKTKVYLYLRVNLSSDGTVPPKTVKTVETYREFTQYSPTPDP